MDGPKSGRKTKVFVVGASNASGGHNGVGSDRRLLSEVARTLLVYVCVYRIPWAAEWPYMLSRALVNKGTARYRVITANRVQRPADDQHGYKAALTTT